MKKPFKEHHYGAALLDSTLNKVVNTVFNFRYTKCWNTSYKAPGVTCKTNALAVVAHYLHLSVFMTLNTHFNILFIDC